MNPSIVALLRSPAGMLAFAVFLYLVLWTVSAGVLRFAAPASSTDQSSGRIGALDGLRGVLAIAVFVHHCAIAYVFDHTGAWQDSRNPTVIHLGQTAVALFFMITGFLFTRKTMSPHFGWWRFLRGRLARIAPLYFVAVVIVFGCVAVASGGTFQEDPMRVVRELGMWLSFAWWGLPDINAYPMSYVVIAGVAWTLKYEVAFYLVGVPALFVINRLVSRPVALACTLFSIATLLVLHRGIWLPYGIILFSLHFLAGVAVAYVYEMRSLRRWLETPTARWVGAAAACSLAFTVDGQQVESYLATLVVFAVVVGGASIFGLLCTRPAIWLGDISYGVYLLHGIVLWLSYRAGLGPTTLPAFLMFSIGTGMVAVLWATASYLRLELPAMRRFHVDRPSRHTRQALTS